MGRVRTEPGQASGALGMVEAFVNTRYGERRYYHEELGDAEAARAWLMRHGLLNDDEVISEGDLRRTRSVREALRTLLRANTTVRSGQRGVSLQQPAPASATEGATRAMVSATSTPARDQIIEAQDILNTIAAHAPLIVRFRGADQTSLEPDITGVDGALARLLAATALAQADGSWGRLKICANEPCSRAFYDTSKNHSGVWCAMGGCGNRLNARASRARRRRERQP